MIHYSAENGPLFRGKRYIIPRKMVHRSLFVPSPASSSSTAPTVLQNQQAFIMEPSAPVQTGSHAVTNSNWKNLVRRIRRLEQQRVFAEYVLEITDNVGFHRYHVRRWCNQRNVRITKQSVKLVARIVWALIKGLAKQRVGVFTSGLSALYLLSHE